MTLRRGTALTTVLTVAAAAGALAFAGFTTFSGKSLCSLMSCDGAKSASVTPASNAAHECPFHDQIAAEQKAGCAGSCAGMTGSCAGMTGCCAGKSEAASFVTMNASFPVAIPAAFNDGKGVCPTTLVKASNGTCSKTASAGCCSKSQAQTMAASNEVKASGCCKDKAQAQTIAASNETKSASGCCPLAALKAQTVAASNQASAGCASACAGSKAACDPAACAAKGCDPGQCNGHCSKSASFVTMNASFPVAIPAAFDDQKQVCPTTLVKANACSNKVSDSGCCKGTGVRADGKACCGKCTKTTTADSEQATEKTDKSEG